MSIPAGTRLGRYEIRTPLGAGGMGEVYLAEDVRLERTVALKILPADVASDQQRMRRFEQEARAASSLNHPNVAHIYEIEEENGYHFIAMEYIEGATLRGRMTAEPLSLHEALDIAQQSAAALVAAHAAGIVHRDIKPENIMVRHDGYIKVLDFGLAKLTERPEAVMDTEAPTKALVNTGPGVVMGTARYMSPEQARGREVDVRTDIWSLGVVLYEMVAGRSPFEGATSSDVITAVLSKEPPPLARYAREVPEALEWIVTKALAKERDERYQTAKEMLVDLRRVKHRLEVSAEVERSLSPDSIHVSATRSMSPSVAPISTNQTSAPATSEVAAARTTSSAEYLFGEIKRHKIGVIIALVLTALVIAGGFVVTVALVGLGWFVNQPLPDSPRRQSNQKTSPLQAMKISRLTTSGKAGSAAISPDGKYVVYVVRDAGQRSLWVRQVATASIVQIVAPAEVQFQGETFSPDGNYVYYVVTEPSNRSGALYQVPVLSGVPRRLLVNIGSPVTFSPDGKQLAFLRFNAGQGEDILMIANADGTDERRLTSRKTNAWFQYNGPAWSPNGKQIACGGGSYAGGYQMTVVAVNVQDGSQKEMTKRGWESVGRIAWLPDGSGLVLTAQDKGTAIHQIWQLSYPNGEAYRITNDLNNYGAITLTADASALVTTQSETVANLWVAPSGEATRARQLTSGKSEGLVGVSQTPDGRIIYTSMASGKPDLWIMDGNGNNHKQLTSDADEESFPVVSPDGRYIVFASDRAGLPTIWRMDLDGGNQKQLLTRSSEDYTPAFTPDGQWVVFTSWRSGKSALWKVSIEGGEPVQLNDKFTYGPSVSPDGKLIVCRFVDEQPNSPDKIAILSIEGGEFIKTFDLPLNATSTPSILWSADGRSILYVDTRNDVSNLWSQPIAGGPPKQVTDFKTDRIFRFDWSRDGRQLVISRGASTYDVVLINSFK